MCCLYCLSSAIESSFLQLIDQLILLPLLSAWIELPVCSNPDNNQLYIVNCVYFYLFILFGKKHITCLAMRNIT